MLLEFKLLLIRDKFKFSIILLIKMKDIPRIITGILLILFGLALVFAILTGGNYIALDGLSLISLILGVIILSNKKENKIEAIRKK